MCIIILYSLIKVIFKKRKYLLSRADNLISAPNFYCRNFNDRAVPWVPPFELSVCKCRNESGIQCVTNGANNLSIS